MRLQPHYKQYLPAALMARLKAESRRTGAPMQTIVRRLLDTWLPQIKSAPDDDPR